MLFMLVNFYCKNKNGPDNLHYHTTLNDEFFIKRLIPIKKKEKKERRKEMSYSLY